MNWVQVYNIELPHPVDILSGISVYLWKTHVINKRICSARTLRTFSVVCTNCNKAEVLRGLVLLFLTSDRKSCLDFMLNFFTSKNLIWNETTFEKDGNNEDILASVTELDFAVILQEFLPKDENITKCQQIVILDSKSFIFVPLAALGHASTNKSLPTLMPNFIYKIEKCANRLLLKIIDEKLAKSPSCLWLQNMVLPKISKWSSNIDNRNVSFSSLSLLNVERYNHVYQRLKSKYGKKLTQMWSESTDPQKYVYEDIAIAAYILVLWESETTEWNLTKKQRFVDLGCGNGLLVYLLMSEGYEGMGIDVRSRKIWNLYEPRPCLKEISIVPSDRFLVPEYDWLIGNHSDELTPWIPVIASRSSFRMKYFLLPCCSYDFYGKFQRNDSSKTQYRSYLDYIHLVGKSCGFNVKEDKMRIPSTKRICFIGGSRTYLKEESDLMEENITSLIQASQARVEKINESSGNKCTTEFIPREKEEKTRNCTSVDSAVIKDIITEVFIALLSLSSKTDSWNEGGAMKLSDIAKRIGSERLIKLKSECGGLQTLLKNHHQIFQVSKGEVCIKKPQPVKQSTNKRLKTKLCWFHENHPNGCPVHQQRCAFAHGKTDIVSYIFD